MGTTRLVRVFHRRKAVLFAVLGVLLGGLFLWSAGVHIYVVNDAGNKTRIVAFHSMSVSTVLAKVNTRPLRPEDVITPDVAAVIPHGEIAIVRAKPVTLTIDQTSETIYSTVGTVGDLLADNGIKLNAEDKVSPDPTDPVPYNEDVVVKRTTYAYTTKTEAIAYQRVYRKNPYMEVGRSYISVMGQNGLLKKTIKVTKVAQQAVGSAVVKTQTIKPVIPDRAVCRRIRLCGRSGYGFQHQRKLHRPFLQLVWRRVRLGPPIGQSLCPSHHAESALQQAWHKVG
jgi:hypothetical protein